MREKGYSVGIKIFSVIALLYAAYFHLFPLFFYTRMNKLSHSMQLFLSLTLIISLIFVMQIKNWARILFVSLMILQLLITFPAVIKDFSIFPANLHIIFAFFSAALFMLPKVKEQFK